MPLSGIERESCRPNVRHAAKTHAPSTRARYAQLNYHPSPRRCNRSRALGCQNNIDREPRENRDFTAMPALLRFEKSSSGASAWIPFCRFISGMQPAAFSLTGTAMPSSRPIVASTKRECWHLRGQVPDIDNRSRWFVTFSRQEEYLRLQRTPIHSS